MRKITTVTVIVAVSAIVLVIVNAPLSMASAQESAARASRHWKSDLQHGHRPIIKPQLSDTRPKVPSQLQSDTLAQPSKGGQNIQELIHNYNEANSLAELMARRKGCPGNPLCEMRK